MRRREFLVATAALAAACGRPVERVASNQDTGVAHPPASTSPLLLVNGGGNGFGDYLGEMLGGDGVIGLSATTSAAGAPALLADAAGAVIYGGPLTAAWLDAAMTFVERGGLLVAVAPDAALLMRFGIEDRGEMAAGGVHLASRTDTVPLRLHVPGRRWTAPRGADVLATFASADGGSAPAAVGVSHGRGRCIAWAFDLAHNVALIRQGNPEWAGVNRDGLAQQQVVDMMTGWMRPETLTRPDADLYQQAVTAALAGGTAASGPHPIVDYFPGTSRSVMVATSDSHAGGAAVLDALLRRVEDAGGRLSLYYTPPRTSGWRLTARHARWTLGQLPLVGSSIQSAQGPPSPAMVDDWRARGHEFAPHPYVDEEFDLDGGLAAAWQAFADDGYGVHHVSTRTHKILWSGWVDTALAQRRLGVRMNVDAYHLGPAFRGADGRWAHGHLIGSGFPLRFVEASGRLVDAYQQPTQIVDEHLIGEFGGMENLSPEAAVTIAEAQIADAVNTTPAALCAQFHADGFIGAPQRVRAAEILLDGTLAACRRADVPVWTTARWLGFVDARRACTPSARSWNAETRRLTTTVTVPSGADPGVAVVLPADVSGAPLTAVTVNGAAASLATFTRGGHSWARCVVSPGTVQLRATYAAG